MGSSRLSDVPELQKLEEVFRRHPEVRAVYVFGSVAAGKAGRGSDLDLAIFSKDSSLKERKLDILAELAQLGYCNVDLVFLNEDDFALAYETVRQNRLVYSTAGFDRGETYSRIVRKYLDFEPYLRIQREAYKRRIVGAQT